MLQRQSKIDEYNIELPQFEFEDPAFLNLSNEDATALLKIIDDVDTIKQFKKRLKLFMTAYHHKNRTDFNFDLFYEKFIARIRKRRSAILKINKILVSDALFETINNVPSFIFMALVAILDVAALSTLGVSVFTILLTTLTLGSSVFYVIAEHRERKKNKIETESDLDFLFVRIASAEAIVYCLEKNKRAGTKRATEEYPFKPHPTQNKPYKPFKIKDVMITLKPAIIKGVMTTTMLLGTYYLGLSVILTAIGAAAAAAAMLGPIGLGIAAGLALVIGIYCGYRQFQESIEEDKIEKLHDNIHKTLKTLNDNINNHYRSLANIREPNVTRPQHAIDRGSNHTEVRQNNNGQNQLAARKGLFGRTKHPHVANHKKVRNYRFGGK